MNPKDPPFKVIRSTRRKKTISAGFVNGVLVIHIPARLSRKEEEKWIKVMKEKAANRKLKAPRGNDGLTRRAEKLNATLFDGELEFQSISFSDRQNRRHGSCNTLNGVIRISSRLSTTPTWVLDYVIVHELAHLIHPDHSRDFWRLVNRYKYAERARGFLIAKGMENEDEL